MRDYGAIPFRALNELRVGTTCYASNPCLEAMWADEAIDNRISSFPRILRNSRSRILVNLAAKQPMVVGLWIDEVFKTQGSVAATDSTKFVWTGITDRGLSEYHCMLLVGYDDDTQEYLLLNSFGTKWGSQGIVYMPYTAFEGSITVTEVYSIEDYVAPRAGASANSSVVEFEAEDTLRKSARFDITGTAPRRLDSLEVAFQNYDRTSKKVAFAIGVAGRDTTLFDFSLAEGDTLMSFLGSNRLEFVVEKLLARPANPTNIYKAQVFFRVTRNALEGRLDATLLELDETLRAIKPQPGMTPEQWASHYKVYQHIEQQHQQVQQQQQQQQQQRPTSTWPKAPIKQR